MERISSFEAKVHLAQLLAKVKNGERYVITKHNKDIAMLVPADKQVDIAPGNERVHSILVLVLPEDVQRAGADRPGRS